MGAEHYKLVQVVFFVSNCVCFCRIPSSNANFPSRFFAKKKVNLSQHFKWYAFFKSFLLQEMKYFSGPIFIAMGWHNGLFRRLSSNHSTALSPAKIVTELCNALVHVCSRCLLRNFIDWLFVRKERKCKSLLYWADMPKNAGMWADYIVHGITFVPFWPRIWSMILHLSNWKICVFNWTLNLRLSHLT